MNEIRNLSFLSWKQDTAWMESMKGDRWKNLVKKENEMFENELSKITTKEEGIRELKNSILTTFKCLELIYSIKSESNEDVEISFIRKKVNYSFPYEIKKEDVDLFLKKDFPDTFPHFMYL